MTNLYEPIAIMRNKQTSAICEFLAHTALKNIEDIQKNYEKLLKNKGDKKQIKRQFNYDIACFKNNKYVKFRNLPWEDILINKLSETENNLIEKGFIFTTPKLSDVLKNERNV